MNRVTITGPSGELRRAYACAASLRSWSLTAEPAGGTLTAQVVTHDAFLVTQHPLTFVVPRPNGLTWRWPIKSCSFAGQTLTAEVGPAEE